MKNLQTDKEKILSRHFSHELEMLYKSRFYLRKLWLTPKSKRSQKIKDEISAWFEVFLLHARNLYEFFYRPPNSRFPNNMRAKEDYLQNRWLRKAFPKGEDWFSEVSQRLAHISKNRNIQRKLIRSKFLHKVYSDIVSASDSFLKLVLSEYGSFKGSGRLFKLVERMKK